MVKRIFNAFALVLNIGIAVLICWFFIHEYLEIDNLNAWVFVTVAMATPLINISALSGKLTFFPPIAGLIVNTLVLVLFTLIIFLVMIWPMGSKPRGLELICMSALYLALLITETALILNIKKDKK